MREADNRVQCINFLQSPSYFFIFFCCLRRKHCILREENKNEPVGSMLKYKEKDAVETSEV